MKLSNKVAASVLPLALGLNTFAQSRPSLESVVVTATRFDSEQQTEPIAAQVITAEEIRDSSANTVAEVLARLGGVHTRASFTGVADRPLDLRGFGMTGDQNTLVLVNGIRISENEGAAARLSAIPIESIERIEILRGAGAVLYGGGATGGTINIITRSPIGEPLAGHSSVTTGSHNLLELRAGLQKGGEGWGVLLNAGRFQSDHYRQNSRAEQDLASGEIRLGGQENFLAFGFNADQQRARLPGALRQAELAIDRRLTLYPKDYVNSDSQLFSLRGEHMLGPIVLALDLSHRSKDSAMLHDYRLSPPSFDTTLFDTRVRVNSVSPRALLKTPFLGGENRLTAGLDWSDWDYDSFVANEGAYPGATYESRRQERGDQQQRAIYLRDELRWASGTRVSLGVRREHVIQTQQGDTTEPRIGAEHRLWASELAVQQPLAKGVSAYARTGRSFRVANIDENRCYGAPCAALLKPQQSTNRELGVQWQARGLSLRAGIFDIDLENEIHYNALTFSNSNLEPTTRRGIELESLMSVGRSVDLGLRYTRTTARFRQGVYGGVDVTGNDVPLVPRDRIGINLGWQIAAKTRFTTNVMHVGTQRYDNDQANRFGKIPAFTVTDLKLTHQIDRWHLAAGINNLFDERYFSYGIVNGSYTSFNAYPEDLRNAYLSAAYRF